MKQSLDLIMSSLLSVQLDENVFSVEQGCPHFRDLYIVYTAALLNKLSSKRGGPSNVYYATIERVPARSRDCTVTILY